MPEEVERPRTLRGVHPSDPPVSWRADAPDVDPGLPLVVALHGWGMDEDFFALLLQPLLAHGFRLLVPRGPFPVADGGGRRHGASWYHYDGDQERFRAELHRTEALVVGLLERVESELDLAPRARYLLGFSQGGYCGSWIAVRNAARFDGMVVVGARVKTEFLVAELEPAAASGFRALLCHGERDASVRPEAATRSRDELAAAGIEVELRWFDAAHSLGRRQTAAIGEWLTADRARREDAR